MEAPGEYCNDEDVGVNIWQEPRREPLGAPRDTPCAELEMEDELSQEERLLALEEEQEMLSSSVFSLTSHLAQVEFRLRQIQKASPEERDEMLTALEEFTCRGMGARSASVPVGDGAESWPNSSECHNLDAEIKSQYEKQFRFVNQLKGQLNELERYFEGMGVEQSSTKHRQMFDKVNYKIDKSIKETHQEDLLTDEFRQQVDSVVEQFANKRVTKEEIIPKLQEHVENIQRFIKTLQNKPREAESEHKEEICKNVDETIRSQPAKTKKTNKDEIKAETINLMRKASTLIQIFTASQFGRSPQPHYGEQSSTVVTHWGNLRAKLEMSIDSVLNLVTHTSQYSFAVDSYDSDSEENAVILNNVPLTTAVRKHLAVNLRDLLQHGLQGTSEQGTLVPFIGCFPIRRNLTTQQMHIWELILKYYEINNGDSFNSTPARKLSQSFNLDIVGGAAISNKQSLLGAIGNILASHTPYKRSYDAHFKAFVCAALNAHKLVMWLNLILKSQALIKMFYSTTSYVVNTGFQDSLQSLDRLTPYNFDLPVDLAVKQFQNIKDVFM